MIPIADIDLIARNTGGKWGRVFTWGENGVASKHLTFERTAKSATGKVESRPRIHREGAEGRSEVSFLEAPTWKIPTVSPHSRVLVLVDESNVGSSAGAWSLDRVDDVGTDLFVALQL
jgi:hypothetical protein